MLTYRARTSLFSEHIVNMPFIVDKSHVCLPLKLLENTTPYQQEFTRNDCLLSFVARGLWINF